MKMIKAIAKKISWSIVPVMLAGLVNAQNTPPVISDVKIHNYENQEKVDINFKLKDKEEKYLTVKILVSGDGGLTFQDIQQEITGNGENGQHIATGKRMVTWNYGNRKVDLQKSKFKIIADDNFKINTETLLTLIDSNRIKQRLKTIIGVRSPDTPEGDKHLKEVREVIEATWQKDGLKIEKQNFLFGEYKGLNIIGRINGKQDDEQLLTVCAAYDTPIVTPGANSNASGLAGLLEIADIIAPYQFKKTIALVGMDYSEEEFVGSNFFVNRGGIKDKETLIGAIDLDRIGSYSKKPNSHPLVPAKVQLFKTIYKDIEKNENRADFMMVMSNSTARNLGKTFVEQAALYCPQYKVYHEEFEGYGEFNKGGTFLLQFSDHIPFWYHKLPAIMVTDARAANDSDSMAGDTIDKINIPYMMSMIRATIATIVKTADIQHTAVYSSNF